MRAFVTSCTDSYFRYWVSSSKYSLEDCSFYVKGTYQSKESYRNHMECRFQNQGWIKANLAIGYKPGTNENTHPCKDPVICWSNLTVWYVSQLILCVHDRGRGGGWGHWGDIKVRNNIITCYIMHSMVVSVSNVCTGCFQVHVWGMKEKIPMIVKLQQTTYTDLLLVSYIRSKKTWNKFSSAIHQRLNL